MRPSSYMHELLKYTPQRLRGERHPGHALRILSQCSLEPTTCGHPWSSRLPRKPWMGFQMPRSLLRRFGTAISGPNHPVGAVATDNMMLARVGCSGSSGQRRGIVVVMLMSRRDGQFASIISILCYASFWRAIRDFR